MSALPQLSPPTGPAQNALMIGTMYFSFGLQGWSEKYILSNPAGIGTTPIPTYAAAALQLFNGVFYRSFLLGAGVTINWARVSLSNVLHDSVAAIQAPVSPGALASESGVVLPINDPSVMYTIRTEDGNGVYSQRGLRGLRDAWVVGDAIGSGVWPGTPTNATIYFQTPNALLAPTPTQAMSDFLNWMRSNTVQARSNKTALGTWFTFAHDNFIYRFISSRRTGRPFGLFRGKAEPRV